MIDGLILGGIIWLSTLVSWVFTPTWFKRISTRYHWITDILYTGFVWLTVSAISKSLVALIAMIFSGLLMNFTLVTLKQRAIEELWNPQKKLT